MENLHRKHVVYVVVAITFLYSHPKVHHNIRPMHHLFHHTPPLSYRRVPVQHRVNVRMILLTFGIQRTITIVLY